MTGYMEDNVLVAKIKLGRKNKKFYVAREVMRHFGKDKGTEWKVWYKDGDRSNCAKSNLKWVKKGYGAPDSYNRKIKMKLSEDDVRGIVRMNQKGFHRSEIASKFGVSELTVLGVLKGKRYRKVPVKKIVRLPGIPPESNKGEDHHLSKLTAEQAVGS